MTINIDIMNSYNKRLYGDPFFELSNFYMPKNFKKFFKWCSYFYSTNALVNPTVTSLSRYPVTSPTYSPIKDEDNKKTDKLMTLYKRIFEDILNIKAEMINIGIDYNVYGNCFVMISYPFKRTLACPKCNHIETIKNVSYKYKWNKVKFTGKCKKCKNKVDFIPKDNYLKYPKDMKIQRLYPGDMDITENRITGRVRYRYTIPPKDRSMIKRGDKFMIETTPLLYLRSISKNAPIELDPDKLFHFKRPNITGQNQQWGMPLIMPSLKKIFYMQMLNKAQEAIAVQRIIPLTMLFPTSQGNMPPHEMMNLGIWRSKIEEAVNRWKKDPNYIGIFPFPVGSQALFSEGKSLLVTPEIRQAGNEVIAGMGAPQELVFGGLQWTGSSITMRMMENQFLNYRGLMIDFLNFAGRHISKTLEIPPIRLGMKKFKMIDDIQQKQMLFSLNQANKMSTDTLMSAMDMDMMEEHNKIKREIELDSELNKLGKMSETKIQGEIMLEQAKFDARAKVLNEFTSAMEKKKLMNTPDMEAEQWAYDLESMPPSQRMQIMNKIRSDMPGMFDMINKARGRLMGSEDESQDEKDSNEEEYSPNDVQDEDSGPKRPSLGPKGPMNPTAGNNPPNSGNVPIKPPRSIARQ